MRIAWKKVVFLAFLAGAVVLLLRGFLLARCNGAPQMGAQVDSPVILVYDHRKETVKEMALEEYLVGVTAAEMPVSFPLEALKAQSVAARTYTVSHMLGSGCKQHDADVCTSSACCQAYLSDARMQERWGDEASSHRKKVASAVAQTAGEVLLYDGAPIEALYHSASGGQTENVEDVYGTALPYLRAVMSTAEAGTKRLTGERVLSVKAFCDAVNARWAKAGLTPGNAESRTAVVQTTASGRVQKLRLGGVTATGREARTLFSLDSTLFTVAFSGGNVIFQTRGYGHGVGMSQTGANVMALGGSTYEQILHYYYTDVTIGRVEAVTTRTRK